MGIIKHQSRLSIRNVERNYAPLNDILAEGGIFFVVQVRYEPEAPFVVFKVHPAPLQSGGL